MQEKYDKISPPMVLKLKDLKSGFDSLQTQVTITITEVSELIIYEYTNDTLADMFKHHGDCLVEELDQHGSTIDLLLWDNPRIGWKKGDKNGKRISEAL